MDEPISVRPIKSFLRSCNHSCCETSSCLSEIGVSSISTSVSSVGEVNTVSTVSRKTGFVNGVLARRRSDRLRFLGYRCAAAKDIGAFGIGVNQELGLDAFELQGNFGGVARNRLDGGLCAPHLAVYTPIGVDIGFAGIVDDECAGTLANVVVSPGHDVCSVGVGFYVQVALAAACQLLYGGVLNREIFALELEYESAKL